MPMADCFQPDFTLPPKGSNFIDRQRQTTLQEVIDEGRKGCNGRILNALDGEIPGAIEIKHYTSCAATLAATQNLGGLAPPPVVPTGTIWFLVSGAGSRSEGYMDTGGGHTVAETICGHQWWIFLVPDTDSGGEEGRRRAWDELSKTRLYKEIEKTLIPIEGYRYEAIEAEPGSLMFVVAFPR